MYGFFKAIPGQFLCIRLVQQAPEPPPRVIYGAPYSLNSDELWGVDTELTLASKAKPVLSASLKFDDAPTVKRSRRRSMVEVQSEGPNFYIRAILVFARDKTHSASRLPAN